ALVDGLTHLWNRGAIEDILRRELERSRRDGNSLALIFLDLDHFKQINDSFGHAAGDLVLAGAAARLRLCCRPFDALGRYGGEEFLVVLPHAGLDEAMIVAERFRSALHETPFAGDNLEPASVTVSQGVVAASGVGESAAGELIAAADRALYRAKSAGRDRIVAGETLKPPPAS
ncbi:MAG: GGDEF domain-containing protein, partial [Thermoanaerobaculia bacterium]